MVLRGHITRGFGSSRKKKPQQQLAKDVNIRYLHKCTEAFGALSLTEWPKPNCLLAKKQGYTSFSRGSSQIIAVFRKKKNINP